MTQQEDYKSKISKAKTAYFVLFISIVIALGTITYINVASEYTRQDIFTLRSILLALIVTSLLLFNKVASWCEKAIK